MSNPGGRPTKLTPEIVALAQKYVNETATIGVHVLLPTIERLANTIGVHRDTLQEWEKQDEQFSVILTTLRQNQADKLLQNSLIGRYNPVISKLMLSKHGYVDKTEQDITTAGDKIESNPIDANMLTQFLMSVQSNTKR